MTPHNTRRSSLVQENISPWESEQKPDRIGSDRSGIFAFGAELLFWEKGVLTMSQVDQISFFRAPNVSNNINRFSFIPALKFTSSLKIIAKNYFHLNCTGNFLLHNFMRLQFHNEAWSCDISRIEDGGETCKCFSLHWFGFLSSLSATVLVFFFTEPKLKASF